MLKLMHARGLQLKSRNGNEKAFKHYKKTWTLLLGFCFQISNHVNVQPCPRLRRLTLILLVFVGDNLGGSGVTIVRVDWYFEYSHPYPAVRFLELFWKECYTGIEHNEEGMCMKIWSPFSFSMLVRDNFLQEAEILSSERHTLNKMI